MSFFNSWAEQALVIASLDQTAKDILTVTTTHKEAKLTELMAGFGGPVSHPRLIHEVNFGAA